MNRIVRSILIVLAAFICLGLLVFATHKGYKKAGDKICSDVLVNISDYDKKQLISDTEVAQLLTRSNLHPIGKSMNEIRVREIEDELSKHPMIRNIECFKTPEGTIKLNIEQRNPVLRVMGSENYYVDDLRQITPVSDKFAVYLPVATGRISRSAATGDLFDFVQYLIKNEFWNDQIEQININEKQEVQLIPRVGDHLIILGSFDRFEQKLDKLHKFYLYGLNETGWNLYSKIDLQYKDQVVCTRK